MPKATKTKEPRTRKVPVSPTPKKAGKKASEKVADTKKVKVKATDVPKQKKPPMGSPKKQSKGEKTKAPNLAKLQGWLQFADETSKKKHWEYFVLNQFLKGNHNVRGDPSDNTVIVGKRQEAINFPVNKVYAVARALKAFVTRHQPKIEVEPEESSDEARTYARRSNRLLERDNVLNNSRRINKEWVSYGVDYGIGWRQVGYDKEKKVAIRWTIDPFDVLIGSKTGRWEDAPYIIKNIVRTVGYWKNKFPKANVVPDNETAFDEYKQMIFEVDQHISGDSTHSEDEQTAIGHECWYKLFKPNSLGGMINKALFTNTEVLDFEETPYTEYPFIAYESDIEPNEITPTSSLKHIIAPQRMLNILNTQLLEYNHIVNRGRFLKDKNAGFRAIYAKEGHIIERNQGKRVEILPPPPINPALERQIDLAEEWIEEIGGSSEASRGQSPYPGASGVAIERLQVADVNNINNFRENFEDALEKEAAWILKMYSLFERDGLVLDEEVKDGEIDKFGVVGKQALGGRVPEKYYMEDNGSYCDVCAVLPDNRVKVSVTSELGETRGARLELLLKLVEMGLPFQTLLEYIEFPNTGDILERIADQAVADVMLKRLNQPPGEAVNGQPPGPGVPPPPPEDLSELDRELEGV